MISDFNNITAELKSASSVTTSYQHKSTCFYGGGGGELLLLPSNAKINCSIFKQNINVSWSLLVFGNASPGQFMFMDTHKISLSLDALIKLFSIHHKRIVVFRTIHCSSASCFMVSQLLLPVWSPSGSSN